MGAHIANNHNSRCSWNIPALRHPVRVIRWSKCRLHTSVFETQIPHLSFTRVTEKCICGVILIGWESTCSPITTSKTSVHSNNIFKTSGSKSAVWVYSNVDSKFTIYLVTDIYLNNTETERTIFSHYDTF